MTGLLNNELEWMWKEVTMAYIQVIHQNLPRRNEENLNQDSQSPGQDLCQGPPEYKAGVLTTHMQHLVYIMMHKHFTLNILYESL
jgi:hypothetical protein